MCRKLDLKEASTLLGGAWAKLEEARALLVEAGEDGAAVELSTEQERVYRIAMTVKERGGNACQKADNGADVRPVRAA